MTGIRLYIEGGGDSVAQRREMRNGFDALLASQKTAARRKRLTWDAVFHGGRQQTYDAFHTAFQSCGETLLVLLVDSEDAIAAETSNADANAQARIQHLANREHWDLAGVDPKQVHLMVRCMEAWIISDPDAVAGYYGQGFHARSLPNRQNLEDEPKPNVLDKLKKATEKTQKGAYTKIKHASKLLEQIDPAKIGKKCSRFVTFTTWLSKQIEDA
jgi:Domain of unknown function (DUF4276)